MNSCTPLCQLTIDLLILCVFGCAHRRTPYYEVPSKEEDANSPVGPLQHHVSQPEFDAWENTDWAALSEGHAEYRNAEYRNAAAAVAAVAAGPVEVLGMEGDGAASETMYNARGGYGFACT